MREKSFLKGIKRKKKRNTKRRWNFMKKKLER